VRLYELSSSISLISRWLGHQRIRRLAQGSRGVALTSCYLAYHKSLDPQERTWLVVKTRPSASVTLPKRVDVEPTQLFGSGALHSPGRGP
jgi:hypothetical protein